MQTAPVLYLASENVSKDKNADFIFPFKNAWVNKCIYCFMNGFGPE